MFHFTESRATEPGPDTFLGNFHGTIVADAFTGYKYLYQKTERRIAPAACHAHARRRFIGSREADGRTEDILTVISSAARHTLDVNASLPGVLPKLAARALNPSPTNDDRDELSPDRWKRANPEAMLMFRENERRQADDRLPRSNFSPAILSLATSVRCCAQRSMRHARR